MGNAVDKIKSLGRFGSKLGLDRMNRLMAELGVSCVDFKIIHVAGTNDKGSVCTMLDKILRAHGIKTGMYTSPYLSSSSRSEERRVGKECRSRWSPYH